MDIGLDFSKRKKIRFRAKFKFCGGDFGTWGYN